MQPSLLVAGSNACGEFGIGNNNDTDIIEWSPKCINMKLIRHVYTGCNYTVYADTNHNNIWVAGNNTDGQCIVESNGKEIHNLQRINYFNDKQIKIQRVCTNCTASRTFWITNDNLVYGNGIDLGREPKLISCLKNVIDIKSTDDFSVALCSTDKDIAIMIIEFWLRTSLISYISNDIISLIAQFYKINIVYATDGFGNDNVDDNDNQKECIWREIEALSDTDIAQISTGAEHALFLDSTGMVLSCGSNYNGQLGVSGNMNSSKPQVIQWFVDNHIKIKYIASGGSHNLALDINGKVYSWGYNEKGQCGVKHTKSVRIPTLIKDLSEYSVEYIDCGYWHSYCGTSNGKHFLFGENDFEQCLCDANIYCVSEPFCINEIIETEMNYKCIKSVVLGSDGTYITVE